VRRNRRPITPAAQPEVRVMPSFEPYTTCVRTRPDASNAGGGGGGGGWGGDGSCAAAREGARQRPSAFLGPIRPRQCSDNPLGVARLRNPGCKSMYPFTLVTSRPRPRAAARSGGSAVPSRPSHARVRALTTAWDPRRANRVAVLPQQHAHIPVGGALHPPPLVVDVALLWVGFRAAEAGPYRQAVTLPCQ